MVTTPSHVEFGPNPLPVPIKAQTFIGYVVDIVTFLCLSLYQIVLLHVVEKIGQSIIADVANLADSSGHHRALDEYLQDLHEGENPGPVLQSTPNARADK
jgi:hypothetical protein